jgi:hypothetical protein
MNLCSHLQIVSAFLVGGWWVITDHPEIGGVVALISGIRRLTDPWGDPVNYFRDVSVTRVKYRLLSEAHRSTVTVACAVDPQTADRSHRHACDARLRNRAFVPNPAIL